MASGTLRTATVPLGLGRALRLVRVDAGDRSRLLLSVGFEDSPWPTPLADSKALDVPAASIPALVEALEGLALEEPGEA